MHVLINAASANMGGAVTYLKNVLNWLPSLCGEDRYTVIAPAATCERLRVSSGASVSFFPYPHVATGGVRRLVFDQRHIPSLIRELDVDLLFASTGFGTLLCTVPQVLLLRNSAFFDPVFHSRYRELGRSLRRNTMRRWLSLISAMASDAIIYPSEAMRRHVESRFNPGQRISRAIHYGFDREAVISRPDETLPGLDRIRTMRRNGFSILLNVSTFSVQKNLETLVGALPHLVQQGNDVLLITTTSREQTTDKFEYDQLKKLAADTGVADRWVELGYVPYNRLGELYELADLFVFPSFTESFGHSMVEAMSFGLPVVAADTEINREICGDAGTYFDTFSTADCATEVGRMLERNAQHDRLAKQARERASRFSWRTHAERLQEIFQEII